RGAVRGAGGNGGGRTAGLRRGGAGALGNRERAVALAGAPPAGPATRIRPSPSTDRPKPWTLVGVPTTVPCSPKVGSGVPSGSKRASTKSPPVANTRPSGWTATLRVPGG